MSISISLTQTTHLQIYHSPKEIEPLAVENETTNNAFFLFLKEQDSLYIDAVVQRLNTIAERLIDCTQCGNCCKTLMINVTNNEANSVATELKMTREQFDNQFLEKGNHELMILNTIPCQFLAKNRCTIYEHRFAGCREFPGLHLPHFTSRLFSVFMHYSRCPIIFTVVEQLKKELQFEKESNGHSIN